MLGALGTLAATLAGHAGSVASIGWHVFDRLHIGDRVAISPHGVGIAIGYLAGATILAREAPKRGVSEQVVNGVVFWGLIGAVVGARVGYVLSHLSEFHDPVAVLQVYKGGISLIGGIFGAIAFAYPIVRKHKVGFLRVMDPAVIGIGLGIVIGRIGDLIIGDHLGTPTNFPLAFRYWGGNLSGYVCGGPQGVCDSGGLLSQGREQLISHAGATLLDAHRRVIARGIGVNQTALYDWLSAMLLTMFLLFLLRRSRRVGILTCTFVIWYAGVRIITDFLRVENRFLGLTGSQWTSVAVVLLCAGILVWISRRPAAGAVAVAAGTGPAATG